MFYSLPCNYGRPKGYKQQCYTTDYKANHYNKTFTDKRHLIYKTKLNKNSNPKLKAHRVI